MSNARKEEGEIWDGFIGAVCQGCGCRAVSGMVDGYGGLSGMLRRRRGGRLFWAGICGWELVVSRDIDFERALGRLPIHEL